MKYGSLFSGIEAASVAWAPLGWTCAWVAETDPFARAVLRHRYPDVPNLGDVERIDAEAVEPVDLVVFGSPCQSFSVAGKRLGLDDPRGNMALVGLRVVGALRPRWVVWENVPGVLSSDNGRDFGIFLGLLGELGYGFAYRVLDAQHFGVPQRRRRVFVVGCLGDWRPPAAVLFEPESLRGDPAPRRAAGQNAPTLPSRSTAGGGLGTDFDCDGGLIAADARNGTIGDQAMTVQGGDVKRGYSLNTIPMVFGGSGYRCGAGSHDDKSGANAGVMPAVAFRTSPNCGAWETGDRTDAITTQTDPSAHLITHTLRADGFDAGEDGTGRGTPLIAVDWNNSAGGPNSEDTFQTLSSRREPAVMFDLTARQPEWSIDRPMKTDGPPAVAQGMSVRRLTPRECLRLMGLPDDYLDIVYRGKPAADGPKYRATGNSFCVPVVRWIGERIQQFEDSIMDVSDAAE